MQHIKDQILHALTNQQELIKLFAAETERKLADRLNIISLQSVICEQENDMLRGEYLSIMRRIIIEARLYKWDNNIGDELNEIDKELAKLNLAQERHEHRKKILEKFSKPVVSKPHQHKEDEPKADNSVQLGLF